jgi:RNA-directed DNA polymerase
MTVVRSADDFVAGFEHRQEAEQFLTELRERFAKFGLELHADKTRTVEFGRYAERNRPKHGEGKQETFNFLGFTHSCAKTRVARSLSTDDSPEVAGQAERGESELQRRLHTPLPEHGAYLGSVIVGHTRYYGLPLNGPTIGAFRQAAGYRWWTVLRRRSQGNHLPWHRMTRLVAPWLPCARICHPDPLLRLGVITQGGSRMRNVAKLKMWPSGFKGLTLNTLVLDFAT